MSLSSKSVDNRKDIKMSKGAFTKGECLSGSKAMSSQRMSLSSGSKMSSAHGVVPATPTSGMKNGAGRLGAGTRAFSNKQGSTAGKKS